MRLLLLSSLLIACSSSNDTDAPPGSGGAGGQTAPGDAGASGSGTGGGGGTSTCSPTGDTGGGTPLISCGELAVMGFCGECIDEKCCALADLCTTNEDCACMVECIAPSLSLTNDCLATCGLTGSPPGFADLAACASTACANFGVGGECTVPQDFVVPPDADPGPTSGSSGAGIGSGDLPDCAFGAPDPSGAILQLQSEDGSVCVRLERRNDGPGSLANTSWTLLSMMVGPLGEVTLIEDPADICWYSSHHNFNDWAHASSGSRYYEVKTSLTGHGGTPTYTLHVFQQGPAAGSGCSPVSDGVCPIAEMVLVPAP